MKLKYLITILSSLQLINTSAPYSDADCLDGTYFDKKEITDLSILLNFAYGWEVTIP
jgi:hypothetical protein